MSKRFLSLLTAVALLLAACGGGAADTTSTTEAPEETTAATEAPEPDAPDAMLLSYNLESGTSYSFEVSLDQHMEMSAEGDSTAMGDEELPGDAAIDLVGTANFTYAVADGPSEGTFEITITGEFTDVSVTGTVDGEDVSEAPDFAAMDPIDVTIVVDEQGNVIHEGEVIEDPFGGAFGDFDSFGTAPGMDPGQFVGPPLSDEEVSVGDSWTEEIETPAFGDDPIVTSITSTVTGTDSVDGNEVLVIETTTSTSPVEIDLAELFIGLFTAFVPEDASAEETAELDALIENLRFLISMDDMASDTTTWFDAEAGLARKSESQSGASISMDLNLPDDTTGEIVGFVMDLSIDQNITYRLLGATSA